MKRWGKSPPRAWQQDRHGKPHLEQCRIGASRGQVCGQPEIPPQGRFSPGARVGSKTPTAMAGPDEWSHRRRRPLDRIRLTGHPRVWFEPLVAEVRARRTMRWKDIRNADPHVQVLLAIVALPLASVVLGGLFLALRFLMRAVS